MTAFDGAGNTVDISSTGTLSSGSGTTATFSNGLLSSLSLTFSNTGNFTVTATDSAGGLGTGAEVGVSNSFTVDPGPPAQLVFVTQPGSASGGTAMGTQPVVEVRDAQGNPVVTDPGAPNETVTMNFTVGTNGEGATLSGTTTVAINWTTGRASFTDLTVDLVGNYQLTASTDLGVFTADSSAFNVTEGAPVQLAFSAQPSNAASTIAISPAIRVEVLDAGGNRVTTATNSITLGMSNNPGAGTLSGTLTVAAASGEATFSDISIDKAGAGYTINASATGLISATSVGFDITGSVATQLIFSIPPSSAEAGAAIVPAIQVEVVDVGGNVVTTATNPITLAIGNNPSSGTLSGTFANVPAVGGRATFSDVAIDLAGNGYTLVASSTGLTAATSGPFNITVSVSSQLSGLQTSVGVIQNEIAIASQDAAAITPTTTAIQQNTAAIKQNTTTLEQDTTIILQDTNEIREDTVEIGQATESISTFGEQLETLPEQLSTIETKVGAKILTRPTTVKKGDNVSIQFQTDTGLSPTVTVYDPDNVQVATDLPMTEIGDTGIYKTDVPVDSEWLNGDYTAVVSESVNGSLESMVLTVGDTDIQSLSGDIAGVQGQVSQASSAASAARDIVEEVRRELGAEGQSTTAYEMISNLETALDAIKRSITDIPQSIQVEPMQNSIREISELLKQVSSENGVNLDVMYNSIDETTKDVDQLQDKVEQLRVLMDVNREIAESVLDRTPAKQPVVKTWFEAGS